MALIVPRPVTPEQARAWRADGWWLDTTLPDLLRAQASARATAPAVVTSDRTLSFEEVDRESDHVAAGLARLGVGRGDVVSCQLANVAEFLVLHHAVAKRRAILNPIHVAYRDAEVDAIVRFAESRVLVVGPPARGFDFVAMAATLAERIPSLQHIVALDGDLRVRPWDELRATPDADPLHAEPDDPFLLLFTSGTTASPKAVLHTHRLRMGNARIVAGEIGFAASDRVLSVARFSHMWGIFTYWTSLWAGSAQVLLETPSPQAFLTTATRHRATIAVGAPTHVVDLLALEAAHDLGLRLFALSGSVCPPAVARGVRESLRATPLMLWGMTETGGVIFTRPEDPVDVIEQTVGRASRGWAVRVVDADGAPMPAGTEGELVIKGPWVFEGYVNNPVATAESFTSDGWLLTGDLATMDRDGNVRICGRRSEQINRGGVKFHPADVEDVIVRHPKVRQTALVAMPDARLGERACCFVVPHDLASPPTLDELTALLKDAGVAKFKWPERLVIADALPLTPTGKVQRAKLVDQASSGWTPSAAAIRPR